MMLLVGALATLIITTIVTESYLFGPVRNLAHRANRHLGVLFSCFLCFGTWVAVVLGFVLSSQYHPIITGLAFHGLAYTLHSVLNLLSDLRIKLQQ